VNIPKTGVIILERAECAFKIDFLNQDQQEATSGKESKALA
jgi:hypothetical protein